MTWDEQYKAGQGRYWPNEELVRFLGRTYGPVVNVPCRGLHALELGCGVAGNTIALTAWGFHVDGCDSSEWALRHADDYMKQWYLPNALGRVVFWQHQLPDELPLTSASLDLVIDIQTIQHLSDADHETMYKEVARVLKTGGRGFSYHWIDGDREMIFPDHPELTILPIAKLTALFRQSGLKIRRLDTVTKTYNDLAYKSTWAAVEFMKG